MEVFLPFRHGAAVPPVTEVKSTVVVSAQRALRVRGLYDEYASYLSPQGRTSLLGVPTGIWMPVTLMLEHYAAVERLHLDVSTIDAIGGEVGERMNGSVLSIALTLSKKAGVTPWAALSTAHRMTELSWRGGDVAVYKAGPKDAIYVWTGQPCARVPYFVRSFCGLLKALATPFCTKAYAFVESERCSPTTLGYRLAWV
jgi:hypothetical protein